MTNQIGNKSKSPKAEDGDNDNPKPGKNGESHSLANFLLKVFGISIACYFPAFVIVIVSTSLFKPASNPANPSLTKDEVEQIVKQSLESQNQAEKESKLAEKEAISNISIPSSTSSSIIAQGYIDAKIKEKNEELAKQAAKDEIESLQSSWKGDLFSQITFPVVFAIASIFAAFAVKDILTEILKDEEKKKVRDEIHKELKDEIRKDLAPEKEVLQKLIAGISSSISTQVDEKTSERLRGILERLTWLEYEAADLTASSIFSQINIPENDKMLSSESLSEVALAINLRAIRKLSNLQSPVKRELLELMLEYEKNTFKKRFHTNHLKRDISEKLERCFSLDDYPQDPINLMDFKMESISDIRLFQLHELLKKIIDGSSIDEETKEKAKQVRAKLLKIDSPFGNPEVLRAINKSNEARKTSEDEVSSRMKHLDTER